MRTFAIRVLILALLTALLPAATAGGQEPRGIDTFCPPGEIPPSGFTDIDGNPHAAAIECLAFFGIAAGTTDTTFSPRQEVRRDQMASFIARLIDRFAEFYGVTLPDDPDHAFDDVAADNPHVLRINQLAAVGIVGGFDDGTYRPADTVTRDGMASFVNRAIEFLTGELLAGPSGQFTDTAGNPHEDNIDGLAAEGIVAGFGDGTYGPRLPVFRDQMASFLARSGGLLEGEVFTSEFFVPMTGESEVDDSVPGQPRFGQGELDAFGFSFVGINSNTGTICYSLSTDAEGPFTGAHIHEGWMYDNGGIVVALDEPGADGELPFVCQDEDAEVLAAIEADPSAYYVNVHTEAFPAGAVRGQLEGAVMLTRLLWAFEVDDEGNFGQGEEGADGFGLVLLDPLHEEICVYARTSATPPFAGFHIHEGGMGVNGDVVVGLNDPDPVTGESSTCPDVDGDLLMEIFFDRSAYYLNIHTVQHPAGAVRGQLDILGLSVPLSAEEEVDGGEEGATGTAYLQAHMFGGELCQYTVTDATGPFVGSHIHAGERGVDGPIVIGLEPPDDDTGEVSQCLEITDDQAFGVFGDPEGHYVNVHTEDHPAGAVRGQLIDGLPEG